MRRKVACVTALTTDKDQEHMTRENRQIALANGNAHHLANEERVKMEPNTLSRWLQMRMIFVKRKMQLQICCDPPLRG